MNTNIDTTTWERSSPQNWSSPSNNSLKMLVNLNHDYIVSDVQYANYTISADITTKSGDDDGVGVVFDYVNGSNYKYIMYHGGGLSGWTTVYTPINGSTPNVILAEVVNGVHRRIAYNLNFAKWTRNSTFNIKLSNIFSDIVFYVNDAEALRFKKPDAMLGKIGFVTYSQIADFNNIEIYKTIANRAVAKYKLIGLGNSERETEITPRVEDKNDINIEIFPRVFEHYSKDTELNVMYRGISDMFAEIQPIGFIDYDAEIYIRPHNRMWAMYEVMQPPIISTSISSVVMDSFTRSENVYNTINYGNNTAMVVGNDENGNKWNSYIKFDLTSVNSSLLFTEAKLRLYEANFHSIDIEIYEIAEDWLENSITGLNSPEVYLNVLIDTYTSGNGYIEFELTEKIIEWIRNPHNNNGFMLKIKDDSNGQAIFRTREHFLKPEIIISHYDTSTFSTGRSQILTEINIMKADVSNKNTEIEVDSTFSFSTYDAVIYARHVDIPVNDDIDVEIIITKDSPFVDLTVSIREYDDALAQIDIISGIEVNAIDVEILVNTDFSLAEIFASYQDNKDAYIYARAIDNSDVNIEITVNRDISEIEITPRFELFDDVLTEVSVTQDLIPVEITLLIHNVVDTEIEVIPQFHSILFVEIEAQKDLIPSEITARLGDKSEVYTSIDVTRDKVETIIAVKERSNINVEIDVIHFSLHKTEIEVSKPSIFAEIRPRAIGNNEVETEIYSSWFNKKDTEIDIRKVSEVDAEILVKAISVVNLEICVTFPQLEVEIFPRVIGESNKNAVIEPRILTVSNLNTIIIVGGARKAYGFVM